MSKSGKGMVDDLCSTANKIVKVFGLVINGVMMWESLVDIIAPTSGRIGGFTRAPQKFRRRTAAQIRTAGRITQRDRCYLVMGVADSWSPLISPAIESSSR